MSESDLFDLAVSLAEIECPVGINHVKRVKKSIPGFRVQYNPRWTAEERHFLIDNLPKMPRSELAAALGRTESAVKIKVVRWCVHVPSKRPGWLTGHGVAKALGSDIHSVMTMHERGIMPLETLPGKRGIMTIKKLRLYMWAVNPDHWVYFKVHRMGDLKLKRLVELAQSRWDDEWLTPGQAGEILNADHTLINNRIHKGQIAATRWGNWWIKRSALQGIVIHSGKGMKGVSKKFTPAADEFLLRSVDSGLSCAAVGRMMKMANQTVNFRYRYLKGKR